jgi:hypothetical protein
LSQLVPELLLALGGAFLLGNLAAYVRLRPAWREAKRARSAAGEAATAPGPGTGTAGKPGGAEATGAKPRGAKPAALPSRARVLANVVAGLLVTVASLAALVNR